MLIRLAACIGGGKEDAGFVDRDGYLRPSQRTTEKLIILYSVARFTPCLYGASCPPVERHSRRQ
jgi:hypothetical protein